MPASSSSNDGTRAQAPPPKLLALPEDILRKIITFLPQLPKLTQSYALQTAYEHLSLARLHKAFMPLCIHQTKLVTRIDVFPDIDLLEPLPNLPQRAKPPFLAFLLSICPNVQYFRAPCVTGVLRYIGRNLTELRFIDTGLPDPDLDGLAASSLKKVIVIDPSVEVVAALAQVASLEEVWFVRMREQVVSQVIEFLMCTRITSFTASVDSRSEKPLLSLLHSLPPLKCFILECEKHQLWALEHLRWIAIDVDEVQMTALGTCIPVLPSSNEKDMWEVEILRRFACREDIREEELFWPEKMTLLDIDFEMYDDLRIRQQAINELLYHYFIRNCECDAITVRFGRNLPSLDCVKDRFQTITTTMAGAHVRDLIISQDVVLYAWNISWLIKFLRRLLYRFDSVASIQLCKPSKNRKVSAVFVLALPIFLFQVMKCCHAIDCVYLEDAGELVLKRSGLDFVTDRAKVQALISTVIDKIRNVEKLKGVDLGTVIAQLELWAGQNWRVVDGKEMEELDDVLFLNRCTEDYLDPHWEHYYED